MTIKRALGLAGRTRKQQGSCRRKKLGLLGRYRHSWYVTTAGIATTGDAMLEEPTYDVVDRLSFMGRLALNKTAGLEH